jgi:hypothetical protein
MNSSFKNTQHYLVVCLFCFLLQDLGSHDKLQILVKRKKAEEQLFSSDLAQLSK